jgi:hypothetical protein
MTITILTYDGLVTGSVELREYNKKYVVNSYKNLKQTPLIKYFNDYDKVKGNEPFYDAYLVYLAFQKGYTNNYYPITFTDKSISNKGYSSKLRTSMPNIKQKINSIPGYESSVHVFIMCPFSEKMIQDIKGTLEELKEEDIIIHIQGEAMLNENNEPRYKNDEKDRDTGMTNKGSMFGEAFNLFTGGLEVQEFRKLVNKLGAKIYAVKPECSDKTSFRNVPKLYRDATKDILSVCSGDNLKLKYRLLKVHSVYQDITDKDNLASLSLLSELCKDNKVYINLVGYRIYSSNTENINGLQFYPIPKKYNGFRRNPKTGEYEKPYDKRGEDYGNQRFMKQKSIASYDEYIQKFINVLEYKKNNFNYIKSGIVDGTGIHSRSLRSPFNMTLYFNPPF